MYEISEVVIVVVVVVVVAVVIVVIPFGVSDDLKRKGK